MRLLLFVGDADSSQVNSIIQGLTAAGHEVHDESQQLGDTEPIRNLQTFLNSYDVFLFSLTHNNAESDRGLQQLNEFMKMRKPIIVLRFEQAALLDISTYKYRKEIKFSKRDMRTPLTVLGSYLGALAHSQSLPQSTVEQLFFMGLNIFIPGALGIITRPYFSEIDDLAIQMASSIQILGLVLFTAYVFRKTALRVRRWTIMVAAYFFSLIVIWLSFFLITASLEQPTWYFIIDATEQTKGEFSRQISPFSNVRLDPLTDSANFVGLSVFGGELELGGIKGCRDVVELVPPTDKTTGLLTIRQSLTDIALSDLNGLKPPGGVGSIQQAILAAVERLQDRRGVQGIVLITLGLKTGCDSPQTLDRNAIYESAHKNNVNLELKVVVPDCTSLSPATKSAFEALSPGNFLCSEAESFDQTIVDILNTSPGVYRRSYYLGDTD